MGEEDRRARAEARGGRLILRKSRLQATEEDLSPLRGAEAVTLVHRLTRESWSLSGEEVPTYSRRDTPWRFVPRPVR